MWAAGAVVGLVAAAWVGGILPGLDGEPLVPPVPRLTNPVQVTFAVGVENFPTFSPDAETIAFHTQSDIWVAQVGGEPVNRTADHAGRNRYPSWSPDGRQIAFLSVTEERNLSVVPALGGTPRTIVSWPRDELTVFSSPWRWSPDGAELAFGGQDEDGPMIGVLSVATGESVRRLPARVRKANQVLDLSWSPDGDFFAYVDAMGRTAPVTGLSVLRASDGETIQVTDGRWMDWHPTWSSDSRTLFFISNRGGSNDLWQQALDPDGQPAGEPQPVTTGVGMRTAAFSADGEKLVYSKGRDVANVWRVPIFADRPATWSDATQITFRRSLERLHRHIPRWRTACGELGSLRHDLWVLPAAGGEMLPLTTDPMPDWYPRFSPNGKQIAFYAYRSGNRDIWVMPANGGKARQLTTDDALDAGPAWSPDGKTLAFVSARSGSDDIWTVPSDGGTPLQLTDDPGRELPPIWSSDGEHIVFPWSTRRADFVGLWQWPASGGEPNPLTPGSAGSQILSRSGNEIFYTATRDGSVWAIPAGGGRERQLTDFTGRKGHLRGVGALATDGEYLYFVWADNLGDIWVMDVVRDSGTS